MRTRRYLGGAVGGCVLLLTGCSMSGAIESHDGLVVDSEPGFGFLSVGSSASGGLAGARVDLDARGCWTTAGTDPHTVVWPDETRWTDGTHTAVKLENGVVIRSGDHINGTGGFYTREERQRVNLRGDIPCLGNGPTISILVL